MVFNRGGDIQKSIKYSNLYLYSSVLAIRSYVEQPVKTNDFIFLYNGEIYNNLESDTIFLKNIISEVIKDLGIKSYDNDLAEIKDPSETLQKIYSKINFYQNELALAIVFKNVLLFFKDDVGKKSLGLCKDKFQLSSVNYDIELNSAFLYSYDINSKALSSYKKKLVSIKYLLETCDYVAKYLLDPSFVFETILGFDEMTKETDIKKFDIKFKSAFKTRLTTNNLVVFFSGGVDSVLVALYLHLVSKKDQEIYLINTGFANSHDRKTGVSAFNELKRVFPNRIWHFIKVDLNIEDIFKIKQSIYKLIYPKTSKMDLNIGIILHFTSLEAKKYSKVCYLGSGADELFCGYNKYKKEGFRHRMLFDTLTLSYHNLLRDDRIISNNNIELRLPILDTEIINESFLLDENFLYDGKQNKIMIRELLKLHGLESVCFVSKKAMQYGTGLNKYEDKFSN
ncbi:asparagine synthase [Vairimorpha necatrix]|uniref:Asparagine synthase n=1 Tax=Vairimorpha necatrix TaxID=6039 RepID=A0AAX4JBN4_9MICR